MQKLISERELQVLLVKALLVATVAIQIMDKLFSLGVL